VAVWVQSKDCCLLDCIDLVGLQLKVRKQKKVKMFLVKFGYPAYPFKTIKKNAF